MYALSSLDATVVTHGVVRSMPRGPAGPALWREPEPPAAWSVPRSPSVCAAFRRPLPDQLPGLICGDLMGERLPLHTHEAAVVLLPLTRLVVFGRGMAVPVGAGDLWFANPFELYGAARINQSWQARLLLLSPDLMQRIAPAVGSPMAALPAALGGAVRDPALAHALTTLCAELDRPAISTQVTDELLQFLQELARHPTEEVTGPRQGRECARGVARVQTYLQARVANAVSLDELAAAAFMSKSYLVREFHRATGLPPHAYHVQLRVARAARMLESGAPLSRAACDAGFADQSHMSRKFKAAYGITPLQFARSVRGRPPIEPSGSDRAIGIRAIPFNSAVHDLARRVV